MLITIDSYELGLTDLQVNLIAQSCDKRGALRRELAVAHERDLSSEARSALREGDMLAVNTSQIPCASLR